MKAALQIKLLRISKKEKFMEPKAIFSHVTVVDPQIACLPLLAAVWVIIPELDQQTILNHLLTISFVRYSRLSKSKKKALKLNNSQGGDTTISPEGKYLIYIDTDQQDEIHLHKIIALQLALALRAPAKNKVDRLIMTDQTKGKVREWGILLPEPDLFE